MITVQVYSTDYHRVKERDTEMKYMIKDLMKGKLVPALISIALGIIIILARKSALDVLVKVVGGLAITCGIAFIAIYMTRQDPDKGNLQMVIGMAVIAALAGLILIFFAETIVDFFPTLMGIFLILNGLSNLVGAGADEDNRVMAGIMGVISILFGILLVAKPGFIVNAIMIYIGAFFIVNGLMDLFLVKRVVRTPLK